MKKYVKTIIIVSVLALMCIGYFFYLSNRKSTKDATDKSVGNQEVAALTTKDIDKNYPESPKEVVKLYARITKAYYKTSLTDEQIEALGTNARKLFDNELKSKQTDKEFLDALKADIADYNSAKRYIADYTMDGSQAVKYTTIDNKEYASLVVHVPLEIQLHADYLLLPIYLSLVRPDNRVLQLLRPCQTLPQPHHPSFFQ